ncbi:hypothetical protein E3N88_32051 [Mikania micrantha]|uniref:Uncharacterized protein n=1 Tax=Mikania micrantha TaxID=192012 RepID=A0A5N6M7Q5_9ASTR|nr:hypothetical protein E3N88_32051 [Mikania micrantha]
MRGSCLENYHRSSVLASLEMVGRESQELKSPQVEAAGWVGSCEVLARDEPGRSRSRGAIVIGQWMREI